MLLRARFWEKVVEDSCAVTVNTGLRCRCLIMLRVIPCFLNLSMYLRVGKIMVYQVLQAPLPFCPPSAKLLPRAQGLSCITAQNSIQCSRCHQGSAEQSGIVAPISLLAKIIQPRMLVPVLGVQEQCWESHVF